MKHIFLAFSLFLSTLAVSNPVETGHARASLITNLQNSQQESFHVGVRLEMQEVGTLTGKIQVILEARLKRNGMLMKVLSLRM